MPANEGQKISSADLGFLHYLVKMTKYHSEACLNGVHMKEKDVPYAQMS
jgi:hypothetical protein